MSTAAELTRAITAEPDMEQVYRKLLERRRSSRSLPPYRAALTADVTATLASYFETEAPGGVVSNVRRVGGGASKEQFFFTLAHDGSHPARYCDISPRA